MIAKCPKCKSIFEIDDAQIPHQGRYARCSVCRERFFISKPPPKTKTGIPSKAGHPKPKASVNKTGADKTGPGVRKVPPRTRPRVSRPAVSAKPAPPEPQKPKYTSSDDLKLTRYQRLYKHLAGYYANKDNGYKYEISVFCFAYRQIPSPKQVAEEIAAFRKLIEQNRTELKECRLPEDEHRINQLKDEINRHLGMIKVFGDLLKFQKEFKAKGIDVSINQILAVLKDVELGFLGRG